MEAWFSQIQYGHIYVHMHVFILCVAICMSMIHYAWNIHSQLFSESTIQLVLVVAT